MDDEMDLNNLIAEYDKAIGSLSKSMPKFSEYTIGEINYAIVFDLNELGHEYITDDLWKLIRQGMDSSYYSSTKYKPCPDGGLECNIVTAHSSSDWLSVRHYRDCCKKVNVPVNNAGKHSTNMVFFMVSTKTKDMINSIMRELIRKHSESEIQKNGNLLLMKHLLSEKKIKDVIRENFETTIMRGNYYPLRLAVEAVQHSDFSQQQKADMVVALKHISDQGSVHKTRLYLVKNQLNGLDFNDSLQNLVSIGVNPITIPDEFEIEFIPGLLETCESLVYDNTCPVDKK